MAVPRRVLVASLDWPQTAGLMAALHAAGFEATLLTPASPDRIGLGRYCEQVTAPSHRDSGYTQFLREQLSRTGASLILPVCEPLIELVWDLEPEISTLAYPSTEPWQRDLLRDRCRLYEFAQRHSVKVADWMALRGVEDLQDCAARFGWPIVIRGTHGHGGVQVRIVADPASARAGYQELQQCSRGAPFAQKFIRGRRCLFGGLFKDGELIRYFAQETLEAYPTPINPSLRVRSLRDGRLSERGRALFLALRWTGLACAEFICDEAGDYHLLEVNPRPWGAIAAARFCGVDLCKSFAEQLAERAASTRSEYRAGVDCTLFPQFFAVRLQARVWAWGDIPRYLQSLRAAPWNQPRLVLHLLRRLWRIWQGTFAEQ
ncbi:MAG: hypothetical protein ACREU6_05040 [Steroidobacteraceae bacterium]